MNNHNDLRSGLPLLGLYSALTLLVVAAGVSLTLMAGEAVPAYLASLMMVGVLIGGLIVPWPIAVWLTGPKP